MGQVKASKACTGRRGGGADLGLSIVTTRYDLQVVSALYTGLSLSWASPG